MKLNLQITFMFFLMSACSSIPEQRNNLNGSSIEKSVDDKVSDSIKAELGINDSIRLLKKTYYDGTHVYVLCPSTS